MNREQFNIRIEKLKAQVPAFLRTTFQADLRGPEGFDVGGFVETDRNKEKYLTEKGVKFEWGDGYVSATLPNGETIEKSIRGRNW